MALGTAHASMRCFNAIGLDRNHGAAASSALNPFQALVPKCAQYSIMENWFTIALLSSIFFAIGDLLLVATNWSRVDINMVFLLYFMIIGLFSLIYSAYSELYTNWHTLESHQWGVLLLISISYFIAYRSHFIALLKSPNPGYANAIIMLHALFVAIISFFYMQKPLTPQGFIGIMLMIVGSFLIFFEQ